MEEIRQHFEIIHRTTHHHPRLIKIINDTKGLKRGDLRPDLDKINDQLKQLFGEPLDLSFDQNPVDNNLYALIRHPNIVYRPQTRRRETIQVNGAEQEIEVLENDGGGSCLPRAVSQFRNNGSDAQHVQLRAAAVQQLRVADPEFRRGIDYSDSDRRLNRFGLIDFDRTFAAYINRMSLADAWFGQPEIVVLAEALQLHFTIYRPNGSPSRIGNPEHTNVNSLFTPSEENDRGHYELITGGLDAPINEPVDQQAESERINEMTVDDLLSNIFYFGVGPAYRPTEHLFETFQLSSTNQFTTKHYDIYDIIRSGQSLFIVRLPNLSRGLSIALETISILTSELTNLTNDKVSDWHFRLLNAQDEFDHLRGYIFNRLIGELRSGNFDFFGPSELEASELAASVLRSTVSNEASKAGRLIHRMRSVANPVLNIVDQQPDVCLN